MIAIIIATTYGILTLYQALCHVLYLTSEQDAVAVLCEFYEDSERSSNLLLVTQQAVI